MALRDSKEAMRAYKREWNLKHPDSVKASQLKYTAKKRGNPRVLAWYAEYRAKNRDKIRARKLLNLAILRGDVERQPCEVCEMPNGEGHHEDYTQPLNVMWFCKLHHEEHHHGSAQRKGAAEATPK